MWIGSFSKISGCCNTGYGSILLPGETRTLFWQTALIPASSSFLSLILEGQGWTKVWSESVWLGSGSGAQWRSRWKNRQIRFPLFILRGSSPYPCTEKSRFFSQPCFLFHLKTNQHRRYLCLRHSQLWARCHLSFRWPTSNSLAGRNSFCSYTPACPGSSIYPTLCECLSYKSDIISIDLNDGLCPTSHFKGVVSLSPAENLCGRSCWRGYRGVGSVE